MARTSLAAKLAEESLQLEKKEPPDDAGAVEALLEGIRRKPQDREKVFPQERLEQLQGRCLARSATHLGSPGPIADYDWLGRAASLDSVGRKSFSSKDLKMSTDFCVSQVRPLVEGEGTKEEKNQKLKTALPWILASVRFAQELDAKPDATPNPFPAEERKRLARLVWSLANRWFESGQRKEAIDAYRLCELLDPGYADAMFNRSLSFCMADLYLEAEIEIYDLVSVQGWVGDAALLLGMSFEHQKRYAEALACYARALALGESREAFGYLENLIRMHRSDFLNERNQPSLRDEASPSASLPAASETDDETDDGAEDTDVEDLAILPRGSNPVQKEVRCSKCGEEALYSLTLLTRNLARCKTHVGPQFVQLPVYGVVDLASGLEVTDPAALKSLGYDSFAPRERLRAFREGTLLATPTTGMTRSSKSSRPA